ncbi:MAG: universal stress protein [Rubrivivax sp.]|jgi:nucleotide-binding universal stress UspA family protein|nr:universal stress protein [Rubrivivax sp.]
MHKKILHGLDGSEGSLRALIEAIKLAQCYAAELHTISVEELPHYPGAIGEVVEEKIAANGKFSDALEKARQIAKKENVELITHVIIGHEVKTILEYIKKHNFDLLVIGFMGHSALYDRVMGSTCQSLVRLAPCSVLVVK